MNGPTKTKASEPWVPLERSTNIHQSHFPYLVGLLKGAGSVAWDMGLGTLKPLKCSMDQVLLGCPDEWEIATQFISGQSKIHAHLVRPGRQ